MNYILQSLAVFKKTNKQNIELTEIFIRALKLDLKAHCFLVRLETVLLGAKSLGLSSIKCFLWTMLD